MDSTAISDAAVEARSVATAANSVLRALRAGRDPGDALDQLEIQAARCAGGRVQGFDAAARRSTDEDALAQALSQVSIGSTLLTAQATAAAGRPTTELAAAVAALEKTAEAIDSLEFEPALTQGFDAQPNGVQLGVVEAAAAALAEMSHAAGDVVTAALAPAVKPVIALIPESVTDLAATWDIDVPGQLTRLGLRAVRRGLEVLLRLADLGAIERQRHNVDSLLARLGSGEDSAVVAGWFIGAETVRGDLPKSVGAQQGHADRVNELVRLSARFVRLCRLLRRTALLIAGMATLLATFTSTIPHAATLAVAGAVLVLCVTLILGRTYTGVSDLPGGVRGVRILVQEA